MLVKKRKGKVVIINLQKTPFDEHADIVIHESVDKVMELLMKQLSIPVPEFRRTYRLKLTLQNDSLFAGGVD